MMSLAGLIARLDRLPVAEVQARLLQETSEHLRAAVQGNLSHTAGGPHTTPWLRTGALRDSIEVSLDENAAVIGSTSVVALAQELGTATVPPRPFLGPAEQQAEAIADTFGAAFAMLLQSTVVE